LYVACALAADAAVRSGDTTFDEQTVVDPSATSDVLNPFETRR
jgi:hypothetical protein